MLLEEVGSALHNEWGEGSLERLSGVEMLLVDDEQGGSDAGDEAMDEQDVAGHHDGEWGGGSGRIMTSSSYRPPSSYSRVSDVSEVSKYLSLTRLTLDRHDPRISPV